MSQGQKQPSTADQVPVVVRAGGEHLANELERLLRAKDFRLTFDDRRQVEALFAQTVRSYLISEIAAFLALAIDAKIGQPEVLASTVPDWLDAVEAKMGEAPAAQKQRTEGLPAMAKNRLEAKDQRGAVVEALLRDLAGLSPLRVLRASYDAVALSQLGE